MGERSIPQGKRALEPNAGVRIIGEFLDEREKICRRAKPRLDKVKSAFADAGMLAAQREEDGLIREASERSECAEFDDSRAGAAGFSK